MRILLAVIAALALCTDAQGKGWLVGSNTGGIGAGCTKVTCSSARAVDCPCNLVDDYYAVWDFDASDGVATAGECSSGTNCDMSSGTHSWSTTDGRMPTSSGAALDLTAETDELSCTGSCDDSTVLNPGNNSFTWACFVRPDVDTGATNKEFIDLTNGTTAGWKAYRNKSSDELRVQWRSGGSWRTMDGANNNLPINEQHFIAVVMENTTSTNFESYMYVDETEVDSITTAAAYTAGASPGVYFGSANGDSQEGQTDLCVYVREALSADQLCILGTCGPENEMDCQCSDGDPTTWKASTGNSTMMGSCIDSVSIACDQDFLGVRP